MTLIAMTPAISISSEELEEKFVRSSGPGGQNVNKVSTAVQLRFDVRNSPNLPERVKRKITASGDSRLTRDGVLVITAENHRTQEANRREAIARLRQVIVDASRVQKTRIPTRPGKAAVKRRLDAKSKRSITKKARSGKINLD